MRMKMLRKTAVAFLLFTFAFSLFTFSGAGHAEATVEDRLARLEQGQQRLEQRVEKLAENLNDRVGGLSERVAHLEGGQEALIRAVQDLRTDIRFWFQILTSILVVILAGLVGAWMTVWRRLAQIDARVGVLEHPAVGAAAKVLLVGLLLTGIGLAFSACSGGDVAYADDGSLKRIEAGLNTHNTALSAIQRDIATLREDVATLKEGQRQLENRLDDFREDTRFWLQMQASMLAVILAGLVGLWLSVWRRLSFLEAKAGIQPNKLIQTAAKVLLLGFLAAAIGFSLTSCSGGGKDKPIEERDGLLYQQGGRYERSDEDLEGIPEKDPRRLEPQAHFKRIRPEEDQKKP